MARTLRRAPDEVNRIAAAGADAGTARHVGDSCAPIKTVVAPVRMAALRTCHGFAPERPV